MRTMGEGEVGKVPIRQEIKGKKKTFSGLGKHQGEDENKEES